MDIKKGFCEECRDDVSFKVVEKELKGVIKEKTYCYIGKVAYCAECGAEIYMNEINDYNLEALYSEYRKENGIISIDKILEIPKKYNIGKRPLSMLLGWGEQTYTRYCNGDIPKKKYSDILKRIYDNPIYYDSLLEANKGNLVNKIAYEKSKKAVEKYLDIINKDKNKIDIVIDYLLNQCEDITPLALQKALYYVQGFYYSFHQKYLFIEDCQAWIHGPVYKEIYNRYKNYRFDSIGEKKIIKEDQFPSSEKIILDAVVKYICCYSGKILEQFTHLEEPWILARGDLADNDRADRVIEKESIGKYFVSVKEKYNMITASDIKLYAQDMFQKL